MAHKDSHGIANGASNQVLFGAVILNLGLSVFEFVAGAISGSTALIADAAHNTYDAAALLIPYVVRKISRKRADKRFTFGYRRAELIGAMIQLTALILVGLYLIYEAGRRLFEPEPLLGGWIMVEQQHTALSLTLTSVHGRPRLVDRQAWLPSVRCRRSDHCPQAGVPRQAAKWPPEASLAPH